MDFRLTDDQRMLQDAARDFMKTEARSDQITIWYEQKTFHLPSIWEKAAGLGWLGMRLPEDYGGAGMGAFDCGVVFEELGRGPLPGAFFSSGVLGAEILLAGAPESLKRRLLPAIGEGSAIVVPALADPSNRFGADAVTTRLVKAGAGFVLEGCKRYVQDAGAATHFIVAARRDDGRIALAPVARDAAGVSVAHRQGFMIGASEVRFERVAVDPADVFGDWNTVEDALTRALPILGAFITGALQEISEFTNAYTSERIVYGQPIGRYQRVQDNCIEILNHLDATRWLTWETLWKLDTGQDARAAARQCKAVASEAYFQGCNQSHMVFAGPGTDYRHPLMAHSVLAHALYPYLGSPLHNKRAMMDIRFPRKG